MRRSSFHTNKKLSGGLVVAVILGSIIALLPAHLVAAASVNGEWIDSNTVGVYNSSAKNKQNCNPASNCTNYTSCSQTSTCFDINSIQTFPQGVDGNLDASVGNLTQIGNTTSFDPATTFPLYFPTNWLGATDYSCASSNFASQIQGHKLLLNDGKSWYWVQFIQPKTVTVTVAHGTVTKTVCTQTSTLNLQSKTFQATVTGKWIDHSELEITSDNTGNTNSPYLGLYWIDKTHGGNDYFKNGQSTVNSSGQCGDVIDEFNSNHQDARLFSVTYTGGGGPNTNTGNYCLDNATKNPAALVHNLADANRFDYKYIWVSPTEIDTSDGKTAYAKQSDGSFTHGSTGSCQLDALQNVSPNDYTKDSTADHATKSQSGRNCSSQTSSVKIAAYNANDPITAAIVATNQKGSGDNTGLGCDAQFTNPLTWILCPVIGILTDFVDKIDGVITDQLDVKTGQIFCDQGATCQAYYQAWQTFRNIGLGFLVIGGLVIVISQAIGMEILSAYTIRKTLPRILVVAIGITLSWPLSKLAIEVSNSLGIGIRHLIYAPFSSPALRDSVNLQVGSGTIGGFFGGLAGIPAGIAIGFPAWVLLGGPAALLAWVGTAALGVLLAVLVLVLRQIAVILLLLIAPLAIVAYILPNTQRVWHLWRESFLGALLMFPMIAAFIATGRVFSAVAVHNGGPFNQFVGLIAYFAPYFLIPLTLRFAGGAVRGLGGFANNATSGAFNSLKQVRANQTKERLGLARGAGLYKTKTGIPGALNRLGFWTLEADHRIPMGIGQNKTLARVTGGLSRRAFGGNAEEQAGMKGRSAAQHDQKALQENPHQYEGDYAILGMRDKLADGMDETKDASGKTALDRLDEKYGTHSVWDSSKVVKNDDGTETRGGWVTRWGSEDGKKKLPANTDTLGWLAFGKELEQGSTPGSKARKAGEELGRQGGILTRLGKHADTQRATIRSVAAANLSQNGKLSPDDQARLFDGDVKAANGDISGLAIANSRFHSNEARSAQARHATRAGKAVGQLSDGTAFSYLGNRQVLDSKGVAAKFKSKDGNGNDRVTEIPAESLEALENAMTLNPTGVESTKGEIFDDMWHVADYWATQKTQERFYDPATGQEGVRDTGFTPEARAFRDLLIARSSSWGRNDPGGRVKLDALLTHLNLTPEEKRSAGIPPPGEMAAEEVERARAAEEEANKPK